MRVFLSVVLVYGVLVNCALCEESAPAKESPKKSAAEWVKQLGADTFAEREAASKALLSFGAEAEPLLKKALEDSDTEIRRRASQVLAALTPADFSGEFVRIGSESLDTDGESREAVNDKGRATLTINKDTAVLLQIYSNMKISQTYTFPEGSGLKVRGKTELKMVWSEISQLENYFPDSGDPRLKFENTPNGQRVMFEASDTNGTAVKMLFARQAEIDKDPALKAALKAQDPEK